MKLLCASSIALLLSLFSGTIYAQGLNLAGLSNSVATSTAYSTRQLKTSYNSFCLKVRRSSDNAEANVAFDGTTKSVTAGSTVTITAAGTSGLSIGATMPFSTFYAATSCFVTTWYDQSGNGKNAVQATPADQPRIVNAGVMDKLTGKAAVTFQTINQQMTAASMTVQTVNAVRSAPNIDWQTLVTMPANGDFSVRGVLGGLYNPTPNSDDWYYNTGATSQYWVNGVQAPTYTGTAMHTITAYSASPVTNTMSISTTFSNRGMYGGAAIVELLLFPSALAPADRQALETNQNTNFTSLPLHLVNFTGTNNNGVNHLTWQTADESNTRQFIIERKTDNGNFTAIGQVAARGQGNGYYNYNDAFVMEGKVFYRLKMEDIDGSFTYSYTVTLSVDQSGATSKVFPNPTNDKVFVQISDNNLLHTQARLLDVNGKLIYAFTINDWQQPVNLSGQPSGIYMVQLKNGEILRINKK
jgi:hypothetical protein